MVRVRMADGTDREVDANNPYVCADGSLQLNRIGIRTRFDALQGKQVQEVSNPQLICLIRRDLWLEVENLDVETEPAKLEAVN